MQEFVHHKIEVLEDLIKKFNKVQTLLNEKSFEFDGELNVFLNEMLEYFKSTGDNMHESEILNFIGRLQTVKRGFNPVKMQKIESGRRELFWGFAFSVHESIFNILQQLYDKEDLKLKEGEELISNLFVTLYQNNLLSDEKIKELDSIDKIEQFWKFLLTQNTSISSINKKLRMNLIDEDIFLLIEKVLAKIS